MHPLAIGGMLATALGLLAAAVAIVGLARQGVPVGPVLLLNGLPLLVVGAGAALSVWLARRGRMRGSIWMLWIGILLAAAVWWLIGG